MTDKRLVDEAESVLSNADKTDSYVWQHTFAAFVVFFCLAAITLGANPFASQTVAPLDWLVEFPGWWSVQTDRDPVFRGQSDILNSQLPAWIKLKEQIRTGKGALWYPNIAGGAPVSFELGNPAFLIFLAIKDNAFAYYLAGLAKLLIAGFGGYLLCRIFTGWLAAVWGGTVFMLCGFNAAWFFWDQVTTAMWIPWLLWATVMYLKTDFAGWLPIITVTALLLIFGAFPAVGAYGFYAFALLLVCWNAISLFGVKQPGFKYPEGVKQAAGKTVLPLLAVGIAFIMAGITLIPFVDSMSGVDLEWRDRAATPFRLIDLANLFFSAQSMRIETTAFIGIIPCILAVMGIIPLFDKGNRHLKLFVFFHLVLVTLSLLITFGLLPHSLIQMLPVFKNNSWGRLIVITLLGLAVLSAVGLDFVIMRVRDVQVRYLRISPSNASKILVVAVIILFAFQFHSQKKLFNSFNAVVPTAWFFPETPSIKYVQEHLKPLQSVIADDAFLGSGSLSGYGIAEWYAHSFRTTREIEVLRQLVEDPFASRTAAIVLGNKVHFYSPLMNKLAIKYLLLNKRIIENEAIIETPGAPVALARPLPEHTWKQHLTIPREMVVGYIGFLFSTFGEKQAPADISLTVYDSAGKQYARSVLSRHRVADKQWGYFKFSEKVSFGKGDYTLELSLVDPTESGRLTAVVSREQKHFGRYLETDGSGDGTSLLLKIAAYTRKDLTMLERKWDFIDLESDIVIFDNKEVTNGAYFIDTLDPANNDLDFSGLKIEQPTSDTITISHSKEKKGWIVLPMHLHPGWKAYMDGKQVDYDTYLGMLPAIPVREAGRVVFEYRPASFRKGVIVSAAGCIVFLIFAGVSFTRGNNRETVP